MVGNFDYNNDEVMNILNNPNYTDEQKKALFEKYKAGLKEKRKKEIITRLNECAKNNPIITEEEYVDFLKQYNDDDLSKPFETIERELATFSKNMQDKYDEYIKVQNEKAILSSELVDEEPIKQEELEEDIEIEDIKPDVTPTNYNEDLTNTLFSSPLKEEPNAELKPTVFEDDNKVKVFMPEELPDSLDEKGNASAIIISIIAIIIGMVIMYSIIKLK